MDLSQHDAEITGTPTTIPAALARAAEKWPDDGRLGPDGHPIPGHSAENNHVEGIPIPGKFFGS